MGTKRNEVLGIRLHLAPCLVTSGKLLVDLRLIDKLQDILNSLGRDTLVGDPVNRQIRQVDVGHALVGGRGHCPAVVERVGAGDLCHFRVRVRKNNRALGFGEFLDGRRRRR